jgi:hypothetical protein
MFLMFNKNKLVYLASPYSAYPWGREKAYVTVCHKAAELMEQGINIFCPIAHSHAIEMDGMNGVIHDGDWWLKQDYAVLDCCDELWVYKMPGWDKSYGIDQEIKRAKWEGIPIKYLEFEEVIPFESTQQELFFDLS